MTAMLGALFLATSAVLYRWAYIHHRRPQRSHWARNGTASMLVQFAILAALAAGASFAVQFFLTGGIGTLTAVEDGAVIGIAVATVWLFRVLNGQWRRFRLEAPAPGVSVRRTQTPANDPGPGLPPAGGLAGGRPRQAS